MCCRRPGLYRKFFRNKEEDQNRTDIEKSLGYLLKEKQNKCIIHGLWGGEIDHCLGKLFAISHYAEKIQITAYHVDEKKQLVVPLINKHQFTLKPKTTISLISTTNAEVTSQGLEWELNRMQINPSTKQSLRNRSKNSFIEITAHEGSSFMIINDNLQS